MHIPLMHAVPNTSLSRPTPVSILGGFGLPFARGSGHSERGRFDDVYAGRWDTMWPVALENDGLKVSSLQGTG